MPLGPPPGVQPLPTRRQPVQLLTSRRVTLPRPLDTHLRPVLSRRSLVLIAPRRAERAVNPRAAHPTRAEGSSAGLAGSQRCCRFMHVSPSDFAGVPPERLRPSLSFPPVSVWTTLRRGIQLTGRHRLAVQSASLHPFGNGEAQRPAAKTPGLPMDRRVPVNMGLAEGARVASVFAHRTVAVKRGPRG